MDRIDLKLLNLLQQRTKLSGEIGRAKQRHGAEIYVPSRERELLARVAAVANGTLPAGAAQAIFREILSSSRAAQGQAPIGLLRGSADAVLAAARGHFGACDRFVPRRSWREIVQGLEARELEIAVVTAGDLATILKDARGRGDFLAGMSIVGEFPAGRETALGERLFIVKPRGGETRGEGSRALILIECKNTAHAVKSLLTSMPRPPIHHEHAALGLSRGGGKSTLGLLGLAFAEPLTGDNAAGLHVSPGPNVTLSILGIYPGGEDYGG